MTMRPILLMLLAAAAILAILAALGAFVAQLIILTLTGRRFRFLRWAALTAPALMLCRAGLTNSAVWLGAAGAFLLGWGGGWALYKFQQRREKP